MSSSVCKVGGYTLLLSIRLKIHQGAIMGFINYGV